MKSKIWFYLCIVLFSILVFVGVACVVEEYTVPKVENADLSEYLENSENNYSLENGYIGDAKTAKKVGCAIIDRATGKNSLFSNATVEYDKELRLWKITKGYLFSGGAFVVIEQDTGKVVKLLLTK